MKAVKRILCLLICGLTLFGLAACSTDDFKDVSLDLSNYTINAVFNDENKMLEVTQTVDYCNRYDVELNSLYFHLYPNAYREGARFSPITASEEADAYPNGKSYGGISINSLKVNGVSRVVDIGGQDDDILIVNFDKYLMPTERIEITLSFIVNIPNVRHRLGYIDNVINLGNFYPIACMYENGEFDSSPYYANGDPFYSDVSNYKVNITAPSKYTAAMSGKATKTISGANNIWTAENSAVRDFAIVLGEFKTLTKMCGDVEVSYYYNNDAQAQSSLDIACDSITTFNDMIGKYPYKSFAVVQTHFLALGMEYPCLVYITDSDKINGEMYRDTIVHETAHQWFYGIVGNDQVKYAWVDETITEYAATLFYEKNPVYNIRYNARIADALGAYVLYCDMNSVGLNTKMTRRLPEFRSSVEYTVMTYIKGQVMLDTLRTLLGDAAFFQAFKNYFSQNYLKFSKPDNFIAAFESASKRDLSGFFETWTSGKEVTFAK